MLVSHRSAIYQIQGKYKPLSILSDRVWYGELKTCNGRWFAYNLRAFSSIQPQRDFGRAVWELQLFWRWGRLGVLVLFFAIATRHIGRRRPAKKGCMYYGGWKYNHEAEKRSPVNGIKTVDEQVFCTEQIQLTDAGKHQLLCKVHGGNVQFWGVAGEAATFPFHQALGSWLSCEFMLTCYPPAELPALDALVGPSHGCSCMRWHMSNAVLHAPFWLVSLVLGWSPPSWSFVVMIPK